MSVHKQTDTRPRLQSAAVSACAEETRRGGCRVTPHGKSVNTNRGVFIATPLQCLWAGPGHRDEEGSEFRQHHKNRMKHHYKNQIKKHGGLAEMKKTISGTPSPTEHNNV